MQLFLHALLHPGLCVRGSRLKSPHLRDRCITQRVISPALTFTFLRHVLNYKSSWHCQNVNISIALQTLVHFKHQTNTTYAFTVSFQLLFDFSLVTKPSQSWKLINPLTFCLCLCWLLFVASHVFLPGPFLFLVNYLLW